MSLDHYYRTTVLSIDVPLCCTFSTAGFRAIDDTPSANYISFLPINAEDTIQKGHHEAHGSKYRGCGPFSRLLVYPSASSRRKLTGRLWSTLAVACTWSTSCSRFTNQCVPSGLQGLLYRDRDFVTFPELSRSDVDGPLEKGHGFLVSSLCNHSCRQAAEVQAACVCQKSDNHFVENLDEHFPYVCFFEPSEYQKHESTQKPMPKIIVMIKSL